MASHKFNILEEGVIMKCLKIFVMANLMVCLGISLLPLNTYAGGGKNNTNDVFIVNDPSHPVPITGSTTVTGNVGIIGTPNVSITGTPDVRVISSIQAVQREITCAYNIDEYCQAMIYQVPQGKRLVIESFSQGGPNFPPVNSISTTVDGYTVEHIINAVQNLFLVNLRLYADSGADGVVVKARGGCGYPCPPNQYFVSFRISGYLVDVP